MPPTKSRQRGSRRLRFNHLDALGGIELKAYVAPLRAGGSVPHLLRLHAGEAPASAATHADGCEGDVLGAGSALSRG